MKPRLELDAEQTLQDSLMTQVAVIESQLLNLIKSIDELKSDMKEIKGLQTQKIADLEKRVSLLEDKATRLSWLVNLISAIIITGIVGGLISLILK